MKIDILIINMFMVHMRQNQGNFNSYRNINKKGNKYNHKRIEKIRHNKLIGEWSTYFLKL